MEIARGVSRPIRFGVFEVDPQAHELHKQGLKVKLQDQPFQVLVMLLEHPGRVVTREEIQKKLWPGDTFVDFDRGLNKAINRLREALADDADNPRFVETLPRRGYRFIAPVEAPGEQEGERTGAGLLSAGQQSQGEPLRAVSGTGVGMGTGPRVGRGRRAWPFGSTTAPSEGASQPREDGRWPLILAGSIPGLLLLLGLGWYLRRGTAPSPQFTELQLTTNWSELPVTTAAISPDGKYLAYADLLGIHLKVIQTGEVHSLRAPEALSVESISWFPDGTRFLASGTVGHSSISSVWLTSALGGGPIKLRDEAQDASVSPDGSQICFSVNDGREIWVMRADGREAHSLFTAAKGEHLGGMQWLPSGTRLVYGRNSRDSPVVAIDTLDIRSGRADTVLTGSEITGGVLLPGGRALLAMGQSPHEENLWEVRIDPATSRALGNLKRMTNWSGFGLSSVSATADGKRLVLVKTNLQSDVAVAGLESSGARLGAWRRLTLTDRNAFLAAWTPDGRAIVFFSDRNGNYEIFRQGLDQSEAEPLITGPSDHRQPCVSPDGKTILYLALPEHWESVGSRQVSLVRAPTVGGPSEILLKEPGLEGVRCTSLPAQVCVLAQRSQDKMAFYALDLTLGKGPRLKELPADRTADYEWDLSPDGSVVAIARTEQGDSSVHLLPLDDRPERRISVDGWTGISSVGWSANGRGLYLSSRTGLTCTLLYVDLEGQVNVLHRQLGGRYVRAVASPDGRYLAFTEWKAASNAWLIEGY